MQADILALERKFDAKFQAIDSRLSQLEQKIEQTKTEIYKVKFDLLVIWMIGFMVTLLVASGVIQHIFK